MTRSDVIEALTVLHLILRNEVRGDRKARRWIMSQIREAQEALLSCRD